MGCMVHVRTVPCSYFFMARVVSPFDISVVVDDKVLLGKLAELKGKVRARELLGKWADRYLAFIHTRHKARGFGVWMPTSSKVVRARQYKNRGNKSISKRTLMDTMQLFDTSAKGGRGQERKLDVRSMEVRAGVDGSTTYRDPRKGRLGSYTRTLAELVAYHAAGEPPGSSPREIIVQPDEDTKTEMKRQAEEWVKSILP